MNTAHKRRRFFIGFYIFILILLGLRPQIPILASIKPFSDIGTWGMYKYLINEKVDCFLDTQEGKIPIDWKSHFYHSTFISSAHPNFHKSMGDEFIKFIVIKNPIIQEYKNKREPFSLHLHIQAIKEKKDTTNFYFVKNF